MANDATFISASNSALAAARREFEEKGFASLGRVVAPSEIDAVRLSVERDVLAHSVVPFPEGYVPGFLRHNQALAPYLASEQVYGFMRLFFGEHVRISMLSGIVNSPGFSRGAFHADWPYNQGSAAHIPAPYPDYVMHIVTMWMLTDFTEANGATILVPGSHRKRDHPRGAHAMSPDPTEVRMLGEAGSVVAFDARVWHAAATNLTSHSRVSVLVRYAPWWLNLNTLQPGSADHQTIVEANRGPDAIVPQLSAAVFDRLPESVKPLVRHSVATDPR